jgi:hypothetical protein
MIVIFRMQREKAVVIMLKISLEVPRRRLLLIHRLAAGFYRLSSTARVKRIFGCSVPTGLCLFVKPGVSFN